MDATEITESELRELHALESAAGVDSLLEYVPRLTPQWVAPWHLAPIADLFVRAEYEPVRACVSVPPRFGKTEFLLHAVPWWLSRHPKDVLAYVSYSGDLASSKSKRAMDLAHLAGVPLRPDIARSTEWRTMGDGGMLATGIGGPLTGHGANVLFIDDPTKNREEAESPTIRRRNWEWFTSTGLTRIEPGGSCIVVHTRWHEDDLIGRIKRELSRDWEIVNLPAISEQGESLWPGRWPKDLLDVRRSEIGEYDWWSLFMGEPRPRGGRLFKDATFYDRFPDVDDARILIACDPAATGKTHADHSAIVIGAGKVSPSGLPKIDILEVHRLQVEIPVLVQYLYELQLKWCAPVAIEAVGGFKAVPQMLRRMDRRLRVIELSPTTDKFTRSLPAVAAWNDGRIRVPLQAPWLGELLAEIALFTGLNDAHDDQIDALAHLYSMFDAKFRARRRGTEALGLQLPFG
jgi:predicted phage terminase large subunit-like protein